jgi:glycosyltransferase involved in cell wall biosynthesis
MIARPLPATAGSPRVLFIARAYPPTVGGMENLARQLHDRLGELTDLRGIINRRGKRALPLFLPYATARAIRAVRRRDIDVVHLADALLAPVGAAVKAATGVTVTASICGLDVTWPNPAYQAAVPRALRRLDLALPISHATEAAMRERTGEAPESRVVPLGVDRPAPADADAMRRFAARARAEDFRIVLTVGRLVERKGQAWFAANVLPLLPPDVIYCVIGEGPQRAEIERAAAAAGVGDRIRMLGRVDDDMRAAAYASAAVFAMPNVPVEGDLEGFGLVALEAAAAGLPVVASRLEGITQAIHHDRNGTLAIPCDAQSHATAISRVLAMSSDERSALGERWAAYTLAEFGWGRVADRYLEAMGDVLGVRASSRELRRAA